MKCHRHVTLEDGTGERESERERERKNKKEWATGHGASASIELFASILQTARGEPMTRIR